MKNNRNEGLSLAKTKILQIIKVVKIIELIIRINKNEMYNNIFLFGNSKFLNCAFNSRQCYVKHRTAFGMNLGNHNGDTDAHLENLITIPFPISGQ